MREKEIFSARKSVGERKRLTKIVFVCERDLVRELYIKIVSERGIEHLKTLRYSQGPGT